MKTKNQQFKYFDFEIIPLLTKTEWEQGVSEGKDMINYLRQNKKAVFFDVPSGGTLLSVTVYCESDRYSRFKSPNYTQPLRSIGMFTLSHCPKEMYINYIPMCNGMKVKRNSKKFKEFLNLLSDKTIYKSVRFILPVANHETENSAWLFKDLPKFEIQYERV
jgi:hypothetical protein